MNILDKKWFEVFLDFIIDLLIIRSKKDLIFIVVDKVICMVYLIFCKKFIIVVEIVKIFWDNIVKLYGILVVLYSDCGI